MVMMVMPVLMEKEIQRVLPRITGWMLKSYIILQADQEFICKYGIFFLIRQSVFIISMKKEVRSGQLIRS